MSEDYFNSGGIEPVSNEKEPEDAQGESSQEGWQQGTYTDNTYRQSIYEESTGTQQGEYRETAGTGSAQSDFWQNAQNAGQSMQQQPYQAPSRGFGIASLVLGIISLVLFCSCINIVLAVVAIVFGILQLVQPDSPKGMAIAGIVLSCLSIILFIVSVVAFMSSTEFKEAFENGYGFDQNLEDYFMRDGDAPQFGDDGEMYFPDDDDDGDDDDGWDRHDDDDDDTF